MIKTDMHVIAAIGGGWSVHKTGARRASRRFLVKHAAIKYGRWIARRDNTDLIIHKSDGSVSDLISYGNRSSPAKGKKK